MGHPLPCIELVARDILNPTDYLYMYAMCNYNVINNVLRSHSHAKA